MRVYIVIRSHHIYEEWEIRRVYTTKEQAESAVKALQDEIKDAWTHYTMEEWAVA